MILVSALAWISQPPVPGTRMSPGCTPVWCPATWRSCLFQKSVCFHFNKGSRLEQYDIGFDFDLIKMPSSSGPRKVFAQIPSAILRAAAAETHRDGIPRSHLCTRQVTASCPA